MKPLLDFLKYNNAVLLIFIGVLLVAGAVLASDPKTPSRFFSSEQSITPLPAAKSTDTSALVVADIPAYDLALRIDDIREDNQAYTVTYSYQTLAVAKSAWREVRKSGQMNIFKEVLGKRDFKAYLTEQIGQVIDQESAYLAEAQKMIKKEAPSKNASQYAELVGQEISRRTDEATDTDKNAEPISKDEETSTGAPAEGLLSEAAVRQMIVEAVAEFLAVDMSMPNMDQPSSSQASVPQAE